MSDKQHYVIPLDTDEPNHHASYWHMLASLMLQRILCGRAYSPGRLHFCGHSMLHSYIEMFCLLFIVLWLLACELLLQCHCLSLVRLENACDAVQD